MIKTLLWLFGGAGLGLVVHLVIILSLPALADESIWTRISALDSFEKVTVLEDVAPGMPNPLRLDPELLHGVCQLDLANGVGVINAQLPNSFWSVSIFDSKGRAVYGTTNRAGVGQFLQLGIFNPEQVKALANQQNEVAEGLLIIESDQNELFVVLRLAPPHQAVRERYRTILSRVVCIHS